METVIFHIDVNSAFLSWSAVKMVAEGKQDVRLVPAVVSGDPDDRRSIVTAKSIPAKKYGIETAIPLSMALRKCPGLVVVRSDFGWYKTCSERFIGICRSYSPVLEQFSIDECFIDMTWRLYGKDPVSVACRLKDEIRGKLGFTVNVGVAHNKLLAKMASDFEKPDKVHTLWEDEIPTKMWPLPVGELLWVGKQTAAKLNKYGIMTIGQLAALGGDSLSRLFGTKFAHQLHESASGRGSAIVETERPEPKSYSNEYTMAEDVTDPDKLDRILFQIACRVAHRLRRGKFLAREVSVFLKTKDFNVVSRQGRMDQPTDVTALILNTARILFSQIWDARTPLRQLGIGLSQLTHDALWQPLLFEDEKMEYYRKWDEEYDRKVESEKKN